MKTRIVGLLLFAAIVVMGMAAASQKDAQPQGQMGRRLLLSPQQRLELAAAPAHKDSFALDFTIAVPAAQKYQRHRCVLSGNRKFILKTAPLQRWALRGDTLTVLSEIQLTLRAQANPSQPFVMKFDFLNLDATPTSRGTATLMVSSESKAASTAPTVKTEKSAGAASTAKSIKPDTTAKVPAAIPTSKNEETKKDTLASPAPAVSDSTIAQAQVRTGSRSITENTAAAAESMLWVLIALLLLGIALIALLSVARKTKWQTVTERTHMRVEPMAVPVANHAGATAGAASFETGHAGSGTQPETKSFTAVAEETVREKGVVPVVQAAAPALDLFADERMPLVTPAGLQTALHKLREITAETQKTLAVQYHALEQFSRQTESVRGFLLENPMSQEKVLSNEAQTSEQQRNGHGRNSAENKPAEISLRVLPAEDKDEGFEEVASAIDVLIAASATKPLAAPASAMLLKIDSLRRINSGMQELAGICRSLALSAPLASVESLGRTVLDLQASCEAWVADQSVRLSISLPRPSPAGTPATEVPLRARREIVEAIVNSLYETRKIAVQGPIYFERRVTQLLEYDLPKLRQQFKDLENDEMRRVWEGMV